MQLECRLWVLISACGVCHHRTAAVSVRRNGGGAAAFPDFGSLSNLAGLPSVMGFPSLPNLGKAEEQQVYKVGESDCKIFEEAIILQPNASCELLNFTNSSGCTCRIVLPRNIVPMPDLLLDSGDDGNQTTNASVPTLEPIPPEAPPPSNPLQPYSPPVMPPECPFDVSCSAAKLSSCVGFDSWGFSKVQMSPYSAASAYLNEISCSYLMMPDSRFKVPERVKSFWEWEKSKDAPASPKNLEKVLCGCISTAVVSVDFCRAAVYHSKIPCIQTWKEATDGRCSVTVSPPLGFLSTSLLSEMCYSECEFRDKWKDGHTMR